MYYQTDFHLDFSPEEHHDSFHTPRIFPTHWNMSEMVGSLSDAFQESPASSTTESIAALENDINPELPEDLDTWYLESFPKMKTTPHKWDLSELL